jgi:hypothetical protein
MILAALINYLVSIEKFNRIGFMSLGTWLAYVLGANVIHWVRLGRERKREKVKTHLDRYIMTIWIAAGILICLMVFLSFRNGETPTPHILGVTLR